MKKKYLYSMLGVCGIFLAACGGNNQTTETDKSATNDVEQIFRVVVQQEMSSADLSIATDTISFSVLNNVYEGLYRLDDDNQPQPAGASALAEVSEDGLTYTLKLREDAKWSNGDPVTAADYVYGWQRTIDPETAAQYAYLFESVKNGEKITNGEADPSDLGIKAISDYELEVTLETATPYFSYLLAFPSFFPQNQAIVEEYGKDFAMDSDSAVYNGPFVLADFDGPGTDTEWNYVKNDTYWDQENVALDKIEVNVVKESSTALNLFQDGQADDIILSGELAQQMANDEAFVSQKEARTTYVEVNQRGEDSPFRNKNLRLALSYAIDREALVDKILGDGSSLVTGIIPANMSFSPDSNEDFSTVVGTSVDFDEDKAQEYWEKAQAELGTDSFTFTMVADDTDSSKKIAEYIQGAVQDTLSGIKINVNNVPFSVRLDRSDSGDFDIVLGGWAADYADPSSFLDLFQTGNSYNRGQWSNETFDKLIVEASTTNANDPAKRWDNYIEAAQLLNDEMGVIPLFQKAEGHLRGTNIQGVIAHAAGAQYDYKDVVVE